MDNRVQLELAGNPDSKDNQDQRDQRGHKDS